MGIQLPLPAGWASAFGIVRNRDPREDVARLKRDVLEAKASIRAILDDVATKQAIRLIDVNRAMGTVDDLLSDLTYDVESELGREIEDLDPIC